MRQSTSSVILGISGGLLYMLHGNWTYTAMIKDRIQAALLHNHLSDPVELYLFTALITGVLVSIILQKSFTLALEHSKKWVEYLMGGLLMGIGTVLIPGGNDTLILKSIPLFSLHAIPTSMALLLGVALTLYLRQYLTTKIT